jgi:hypothetical protein
VVAAAQAELDLGTVHAKAAGEKEGGKTTRKGYDRLLEYFHTAAPGVWQDSVVKYLVSGLPSWCGIFATYCLKTGGALDESAHWRMGQGISSLLKTTQHPQPGDVAYLDQPYQHHAVVVGVSADGNTVDTIDGNSGGDSTITSNSHPKSHWSAFFTAFH